MKLYYDNKRRDKIVNEIKLNPSGHNRYGCCIFIKINSKVAAKCYRRATTCARCYHFQTYAARFGFAPRTGVKFSIKVHHKMYYGYLTEIAYMFFEKNNDGCSDHTHLVRSYLEAAFKRIGLYDCDLHSWNVGKLRGRWVGVDFDLCETDESSTCCRRAPRYLPPDSVNN